MLVKYVMKTGATATQMMSDITGIVTGSITSTGSLGAGANTTATVFYGTYPAGKYALVNATSSTFSKVHSTNNSVISYFQLTRDSSNSIYSMTLGQGYTAANDTFSNSYTQALTSNISIGSTWAGVDSSKVPIDIIVNDNMFLITQPAIGAMPYGVVDLGYNGVSQAYNSSMINGLIYWTYPSTTNPYLIIPTAYKFVDSLGNIQLNYGLVDVSSIVYQTPADSLYSVSGNVAVLENPIFHYASTTGYIWSVIYGFNKIREGAYSNRATYVDSSNVYRYVISTDNYSYSVTIS